VVRFGVVAFIVCLVKLIRLIPIVVKGDEIDTSLFRHIDIEYDSLIAAIQWAMSHCG
jgi:hypothetical protein